jgi:UDP-glucose 6-dehydrogenase
MDVTVFGMGHVGCVTAACLAEMGHSVTGVDLQEVKVSLINSGKSPVIEPGLQRLIRRGVGAARLQASPSVKRLGDISLVCVGTPSNDNGSFGFGQVERVVAQIWRITANCPQIPRGGHPQHGIARNGGKCHSAFAGANFRQSRWKGLLDKK